MKASTCHPGAVGAAGMAGQEEKEGFETLEGAGRGAAALLKSFGVVWK